MARQQNLKPEEVNARAHADRMILDKLTELYEVVKPSEIADLLQGTGIGLAAVRSLLSSNSDRFAYAERRWIPAARLESLGRPFADALWVLVDRYGGPMPLSIASRELSRTHDRTEEWVENALRRLAVTDPRIFVTEDDFVALSAFVFVASDESVERAYATNRIDAEAVAHVQKQLGADFDWHNPDAIMSGLEKTAPVDAKSFGAAAWIVLNPQHPHSELHYRWKDFNAEMLSIPGFVFGADGCMHTEAEAATWPSVAAKMSDKLIPSVEFEDATPIEIKP